MGKDDHYNGGREGHKVGFRVRGSIEGAGSARASEIAEKALARRELEGDPREGLKKAGRAS